MGTATKPTDTDHRANLHETLKEAGTVMMMTRASDGSLHGRPMSVAHLDDDNTLYFATSLGSTKILELERDPRIDLVFSSKLRHATIAGHAKVTTDRALIDKLWTDAWKIWFPEGKSDPDIAIVVVDPERGEYWDQTGLKGLKFAYRAAKAFVTGTEYKNDEDVHGKVRL